MTDREERLYEMTAALTEARIVAGILRTAHSGGDRTVIKELRTAYAAVQRVVQRLEQRLETDTDPD